MKYSWTTPQLYSIRRLALPSCNLYSTLTSVKINPGSKPATLSSRSLSAAPLLSPRPNLETTTPQAEGHQAQWPPTSTFSYTDAEQTPRFDWRLRAVSRRKPEKTTGHEDPSASRRRKYIKRVAPSFVNVGMHEPFYEEIRLYEKHFLPLLEAEQAEDEAALKERLANWTLDRLKQEGYCITGLSAFWLDYPQMGRSVASFTLGPGIIIPPHNFDNGAQVLVTRVDPLKEVPIKGSVFSHTPTQLKVAFQEPFDLEQGPWRLDLGRSNIIFQRMCTAISYLNHDPAVQEHHISAPDHQLILQGTRLRDILLRSFTPSLEHSHSEPLQPADEVSYLGHETLEHGARVSGDFEGAFKDDMRIQSWARRYMRPNPVRIEGDPVLEGLNPTQIRAMATMIGERLSLIQGPPGTGKTKTIIETIKLLKSHFEVVHPILVCTYTNVAVDNLVEGFVASGLKPLRIGFGKVKQSLVHHTLDDKLSKHPLKPRFDQTTVDLEAVQKKIRDLGTNIRNIRSSNKSEQMKRLDSMETHLIQLQRQERRLSSKAYAIHQEMLEEIVSHADVVCTTCITSASTSLNVIDFPVVFLDEASMSTEPASLIPIMKGSRHLALIGDHKQLPPVITSREAQSKGLGISLFERLAEEGVVPSVMLDVQYRMHPDISLFPSIEFYNWSLIDGTVDAMGNISSLLTPPKSSHLEINPKTGRYPSVVFLDHAGSESQKDRSRVNWNEAHIVCSIVEDLLLHNEHISGRDIGIIAPYAAQISLLTRLFNTNPTYRKRFEHVLGEHRAAQLENIEIKTVDGFEGREKDVIIFSTVRNNPYGHIGFLADRRRLNVGLTRAKRGLFVVGSISTLKTGKSGERSGATIRVGKGAEAWKRYTEFLNKHGLVLQLTGDKLRRTLYENYVNTGGVIKQ